MSKPLIVNWEYKLSIADFGNEEKLNELKGKGGVYLWVTNKEGLTNEGAIWYVGETDDFLSRFKEHFIWQIGGGYRLFDILEAQLEWHNNITYETDRNKEEIDPVFVQIADEKIFKERVDKAYGMLKNSFFAFGVIENSNSDTRKEVEGSILRFLYDDFCKGQRRRLLGRVSRNPTEGREIHHNNVNGVLNSTLKFYEDHEKVQSYPFKKSQLIKIR